jgi:alpha-1,2-mannosyltransferase
VAPERPQRVARRVAWALALVLAVVALAQGIHKARKGQSALLKWRPQVEALFHGESMYGREEGGTREGFPTPPTTALGLAVFLALDDVPASIAWALFKVALASWMIATVARMCAGSVREFPPWALVAVLLLSWRVLLSDVTHGNINIPVAAAAIAAGRSFQLGRERSAGLFAGLAAVLKVTPALLVAWFAWKRSPRAVAYFFAGVALFGFAFPMAVLGPERHLALLDDWSRQMLEPFLTAAPITVVQSEQINQSLLGVLARLFTDSTAIRARPPLFPEDVSIALASLSDAQLRLLWAAGAAAVLGFAAWCSRVPRERRAGPETTAELALVLLAMLFLSERSWKQHYVTLCVPIAWLAWIAATRGARDRSGRLALAALIASAVLHGLTGSGVLGDRASDFAEAYGAWFLGGLALFVATGTTLRTRLVRG